MASIDKTYTDDYKEYKKFKDWADKQVLIFFDGHKECIGNWIWDHDKKDFNNGKIPIMNTPTWLDIYLIQKCKSKFVLDRMQDVYDKKEYKEFQNIDLTAKLPENFRQNRKITVTKNKKTKFPIHNKPYGGKMRWWLQCNDDYWYNDETKTWSHYDNYYPHNTNTAHVTSIKSLIRHLRKQFLPRGVKFTISGRYVGEEYSVMVH